ncbi:sensor domain-containing diguanylate cyclase [Leptospira adleri]|uniref:diguanylate cyclase n=1 Tax=Leptospira adleri TaxID=2023186 RepID=A0A2M9YKC7_9LEPT|nr:sensor domain-containing diguanylate cyclase [Leptospira adleri]PJZ51989.1 diguanylate cyclase [Leptospira adleri]PJZ60780.1 diguanylate cyclase [Leptospira adleri]
MTYKNEYNLEKFYNYSLDLFSIQRMDGTVISVNPAFEKILSWAAEDLLGKNPFDLLHPEDVEETMQEFSKLNTGVPKASIQNRLRCANGDYKYLSWTGFPDLEAGLVYITGRDITELIESNQKISQLAAELKEANDQLFEQASTDPLTKLKNRRAFNEELHYQIHLAQKQESQISLMMIDADHFKAYNDQFGHPEGDRVLILLADLLSKVVRENGIVARYGGEEFIVALPDTSVEAALSLAETMLKTIRNFSWDNKKITISIGISTFQFDSSSLKSKDYVQRLIETADRALYQSKIKGRDRATHCLKVDSECERLK